MGIMRPRPGRMFVEVLAIACFCSTAPAADLSVTISMSQPAAVAGGEARFWLNVLNVSDRENGAFTFPIEIECRLDAPANKVDVRARRVEASAVESVTLGPGTFSRREYAFPVPEIPTGDVALEMPEVSATRLVLTVEAPPPGAATQPAKGGLLYFLKGAKHSERAAEYEPDTFFKQHIFGYEPFYFIAGTKSPNAKFQLSFKYRLVNELSWLAEGAPLLTGFHLAYSQTSLWDWNAPSAPFFDSSYRPEFLYSWDRVVGGAPTNWFRLDLQGGVQHESNGRDGASSRSLNIAYLRPRVTFGRDSGPQLSLIPRAWVYVGDLSDNPDIADYRGYADLRGTFGWKRGLQVSALGRIGQGGEHASLQVDATYPLMQPPYGAFSIYLHAQYFTGYGESLLGYKETSENFRVGISLYR